MTSVTGSLGEAYARWHASLEVDGTANDPWYRLVRKHLDPSRDLLGKRLLEIGCGRGGFACWLARQALRPKEIVAADFASTAIDKGRAFAEEQGCGGITWEVDDIQAISHPAHSFDTIVSCETIEHVPDPRLALRELGRVLRPGGRLFLTTPNYFGMLGLYRIYLGLRGRRFQETGQPINNFMLLPHTIQWVKRTGLRITLIDGIGHYLPFPGRPPIEMRRLNKPGMLMKWVALHSLIIAKKPRET